MRKEKNVRRKKKQGKEKVRKRNKERERKELRKGKGKEEGICIIFQLKGKEFSILGSLLHLFPYSHLRCARSSSLEQYKI